MMGFTYGMNSIYCTCIHSDVVNATMRRSVAFECADDAKKNKPNIYFHVQPSENCPGVRKQWIYTMDLDFHRVPCENIYSDHFSLHH